MELIGKSLGGYRIVKQIGLGGMATVFKAYQPSMDRYVALKVLSTHLSQDPTFVKRFEQEVKVIARLEHLHILPVYDYGDEDGYLYLVMRFIEGGTLTELMEQAPLDLAEARRVVTQVGLALEHAHQQGIVHRDFKPSNVLLDAQGDCFLSDFGIAKMVESSLGLTGSAVIGTPHYMAPEQSQSQTVDHRADIYAVGVVIYQMVTGQVPFDAETPFAVVMKHISQPLPLPSSLKPDLPETIERVILKALAKDPDDRYQHMAELVAAFDEAVQKAQAAAGITATRPAVAPPTTVRQRRTPSRERRPLAWLLTLLLAASLAIGALGLAGLMVSRLLLRGDDEPVAVNLPTPTAAPTSAPATTVTPTPLPTPGPLPTATLRPSATPTLQAITPPEAEGVTLKWRYTAPTAIWHLDSWGDGLAAGDLNGDEIPDIVFGTEAGEVLALAGDTGEPLWAYQVSNQNGPVNADVVDLDGDGLVEVIGTGKGDKTSAGQATISALDRHGHLKWQAQADFEEVVDLAYGDINGDGDTELAVSAGTYPWGGGQVVLLDGATGTRLWAQSLGDGQAQGIAVGDVDGDGQMEIAVENYDNKLFLLAGETGRILWTRPKGYHGRDVLIADVDSDGAREIVSVVAGTVAFNHQGNEKWRSSHDGELVTAADVTGDGRLELVISSRFGGLLHVVEGDSGELLWSRSRSGIFAVGDVNADKVADIIAGTVRFYGLEPPFAVEAVDAANTRLWYFPLANLYNEPGFGLVTVNLDNDPELEVVVANGTELLVLDPIREAES